MAKRLFRLADAGGNRRPAVSSRVFLAAFASLAAGLFGPPRVRRIRDTRTNRRGDYQSPATRCVLPAAPVAAGVAAQLAAGASAAPAVIAPRQSLGKLSSQVQHFVDELHWR